MKKVLAMLLALSLAVTILAGCQGNSGEQPTTAQGGQQTTQAQTTKAAEPVTITLSTNPEQMWDGLKAVIEEWEKRTGNKIEQLLLPQDQFLQVTITKINANEAPDILASQGKLYEFTYPPDALIALNDREWFKEIPQAALDMMVYTDGTLHYVPTVPLNGGGMAYNKKIFNDLGLKEPANRKEFIEVCTAIKNAGITPIAYMGAPGFSWGLLFATLPGVSYYDKYYASEDYWDKMNSNQLTFAENEFYVKVLQQLLDYMEMGFVADDALSTTFEMIHDKLATGKVAMAYGAEWLYGPVMKLNPDFDMGFFAVPVEDDKPGVISTFVGGGLGIWSGSKYQETALNFFDFLCSKEMQELFYTITPGTPIFPYAEVPLTPIGAAIKENVSKGLASERILGKDKLFLQDNWQKNLEAMISGQMTPKQALEAYDQARQMAGKQKNVPGF